jgi:hypothetical protein
MKYKLESTTNYDLFDLHELNRDLHENLVLENSMREHGFRPSGAIHVRKNGGARFKVIQGHHRLKTAMKLKLPVWYIVDDDDISIYELEGSSTGAWNGPDFAVSYAHQGNENYKKLIVFMKKHCLKLGPASSLLGGENSASNNKVRQIKGGSFRAVETDYAKTVTRIIDLCREFGVQFATSSGFVSAICSSVFVPEFDPEVFISRVRLYPKMLNRRSNRTDYLEEIEAIYNFRARGKRLPLVIRAHEVGLERKQTFGGHNKQSR